MALKTGKKRVLLLSNSSNPGEGFLDHAENEIKTFLSRYTREALFIPWAGVTISYEDYENKVKSRFLEMGYHVKSIHHFEDPVKAVEDSDTIIVGGGNTFALTARLQKYGLMEKIRSLAEGGIPYIGWSAGANIACPTISTTNDMPVLQPDSFGALNLVSFQINPHYLDTAPPGFGGETREMRIMEYLEINKSIYVVGLREGSMLILENGHIRLSGAKRARLFKHGSAPSEIGPGEDLSFLL